MHAAVFLHASLNLGALHHLLSVWLMTIEAIANAEGEITHGYRWPFNHCMAASWIGSQGLLKGGV